jgi:hypothetical protein
MKTYNQYYPAQHHPEYLPFTPTVILITGTLILIPPWTVQCQTRKSTKISVTSQS